MSLENGKIELSPDASLTSSSWSSTNSSSERKIAIPGFEKKKESKRKKKVVQTSDIDSVVIYDAHGMPVPKGAKKVKRLSLIFEDPTLSFKKEFKKKQIANLMIKSSK